MIKLIIIIFYLTILILTIIIMTNVFNSNVFNSKAISTVSSGLTKEQADALYVNQDGDTIQGSLVVVGNSEISGVALFDQVPAIRTGLSNLDVTAANHLATKSYIDNALSGISTTNLLTSHNVFTGANEFNGGIVCQYNFVAGTTGTIFSTIPHTDIDRTADMTSDNQFVTKKYVDNHIPATSGKILGNRYIIGDMTYYFPNTISGFVFKPPRINNGGGNHQLYINFPSSINDGVNNNILLNPSCTIDFNYSYSQAMGYGTSGITYQPGSAVWLDKFIYNSTTAPTNANFTPANLSNSNVPAPITSINCKFTISLTGGVVTIIGISQSTVLYPAPVKGTINPAPKTISTYFNGNSLSITPLKITYVNDHKLLIELCFPIINSNTTLTNDVRYNGWVSSYGATVEIINSPPFYNQSINNTVLNPEMNSTLNSNGGCAWLSLS
jgi:hypothetical protein